MSPKTSIILFNLSKYVTNATSNYLQVIQPFFLQPSHTQMFTKKELRKKKDDANTGTTGFSNDNSRCWRSILRNKSWTSSECTLKSLMNSKKVWFLLYIKKLFWCNQPYIRTGHDGHTNYRKKANILEIKINMGQSDRTRFRTNNAPAIVSE